MSFNDEYLKLRKKRLEEQAELQKQHKSNSFEFEDEESGLFKGGAFSDGFQITDIPEAIFGTAGDVALGLLQGVTSVGEGLGDLISYGVAGVMDLVGNDDDAERLRKEAAKSQLGPLFDSFREGTNIDDNSLLGDFGYDVTQGLGQVGAIIATGGVGKAAGLGSVGTSALTTGTMFASSTGSGMSEAYQGGATDEEALAYGVMSGAIDAGTEMIFGGLGKAVNAIGISKGLTSLDDWFAKKLSSKISNQFFQNAAEYGIKAGAEGVEEFLAGLGSAAAKKLTYMSEEELSQLVEDENLLEQFAAGVLVSGIAQSGDFVKSNKQGRDFITNFSANEETVIEKVYNDRVAEAEQDGTKLTNKEKNKIYEQVQNDMRKGYISTDTIESVLGGETYKSYKEAADRDTALKEEYEALNKEYTELYKMKNGEKSDEQIDRQAELKNQLAEIKQKIDNSDLSQIKDNLSKEVYDSLTRQVGKNGKKTRTDDFLIESYNEKARRGMAFEADLSQYDDKTAEVVKRAIDSKILNNTRRTHEFVDMLAKISADKGVPFDFTNNKKLKESGFAVGGASVNGYVTKDGITVNISSSKAMNTIVGHEISHVLEGTELYAEMQSALFEYAKSKKDYDSRRKALEELYKNVEGAEIDAELTADLVGDYLFTDEDFINNLSTKHRNVFQKIYDEIKYLLKIATAGSKEARQLEKVKRTFEKAYRANGNTNEGTKYSLSQVEAVQPTSDKWKRTLTTEEAKARFPKLWDVTADDSEVRNPTQISSTVNSYRKVYNFLKSEGFDGTILDASSGLGYGTKAGIEEYGFNVEDIEPYPDKSYNPKYRDYSALDKKYDVVISNAVLNVLPQDQRDALVVKMGEMLNDGGRIFINVRGKDVDTLANNKSNTNISPMEWFVDSTGSYQKGFTKPELVAYLQDALGEGFTVKPTNMFGAVSAVVTKDSNVKYSLSDSDGKQLTAEQSEYFKDSKVRDENGNLKVMYHGSQDAGFHVFDAKMSDDDTSFFFVDSNDVAASYSGTSETYEAQTIRTAEDMNNFIESIGVEGYEVVEKDGKFTLLYEGDRIADSNTAKGIYEEFCWYEGVGEGDANYKVYLNLKNPLEVDAEGRNWNNISREFSQEVYGRYKSLTAEEKAALSNLAEWGEYSIFRDEMLEARATAEQGGSGVFDEVYTKNLARAYEKLGGANANLYDAFSIAQENFSEESLKTFAVKQMNTRDYARKAKAEGYDGVIFKNIHDNGGYSNGSEGASTVAIAFESNQIKSVANEKPTGDADIRYSLSEGEQADNGVKVMVGGSVTKYSLSTWTPETQTKVRENLINSGYEADRVDKWIKDTNSVASVIAADKDRLDFVAADNQVMLKDNQEYIKTLDASTLCAKRLVYQGTFDAIQHRLPNTMLSSDDLIDLLNMMKEHGVQTPCGVCYVESRRRHLGKFAQGWLDSYNGEYKPNLDEVTTSDGLETLRKIHPQTYKDFVDAMNKKGSSNPKVVQLRTEYRNEIMSLTPKQIRDIESIGGLRVQSFSDFETPHLLDMMQAVMDMSAKGLHSQAYTKVPNFAWVFGDTGIKINLSLIAEGNGFDADGNLIFSSTEGMNIDEAMKLRDAYSQNVGTIIVGANDKHILACMADDRIDFIIPFHRSGWGMKELEMMGMSSYTDYTYGQKEHDLVTGKGVANLYPADYWDYTLSGKENAERYLNLCAKTGREPKFSKFLVNNGDGSYSLQPDGSTDGYWKTLIDFKMYDNEGNGAIQQKVQPNFNMEEAYRVLGEYEGGANKLPVANDVVEEFVAKYRSYQDLAPAMSLTAEGETPKRYGNYNIFGEDIRLEAPTQEEATVSKMEQVAPIVENIAPVAENTTVNEPKIEKPIEDAPIAETAKKTENSTTFDAAKKSQIEGQQTVFKEPATSTKEQPIKTIKDRLQHKLNASYGELSHNKRLRREALEDYDNQIEALQFEYNNKKNKTTKAANDILRRIERLKRIRAQVDADWTKRINDNRANVEKYKAKVEQGFDETTGREMRSEIHARKIDDIKAKFTEKGLDLDETLKNAKNLSTFATVDNIPQRVMEKSLGYKAGQILADETVNKVAQNESEGIKWLNSFTDRKNGVLAKLSKKYNIKPGSKESAAAQMYAEGFYVDDNNDIVKYGDVELAKDFPNTTVQKNIKGLANDPVIRQIYDETLDAINESRARNGYPEIKKLDNYFLHFRAMDDTYSKLGLPFNPNDIRAKDLPTDLNGVTPDLKPGQPYFASAKHREGKRTSFDLLGGLERYLTSAKNQIYHIDDIQTLRALRNYVADTFGQANGLEGLDSLTEEEAQERIKQVYSSHLSTFAKFLNEEANILAGKTALIDRGVEGVLGRRAITFIDTIDKQVGANMVGFNVSSSLTNFVAGVQAIAKTNKLSCVKAFAQTTSSKINSLFGKTDSFVENNPTIIRRKGAERFYRTPFQKVGDAGYVLMSAVDNVTTEFIVRAKYDEFIKQGMSEQQAIAEADKWTSRLMGDRSLGQMPQLYNSKMLGLVTKFQLEVRNQLDSQFYDTIQEAKVSNEDIKNGLARNAKTAAKVTATLFELAVLQHLFGKAFESVAGYNPAFDIIDVLIKTLGLDDDEEDEDTVLDNVEEGFLALREDLPYISTFTGGRIPISSALPITELITGEDKYGNEKSRLETLGEIAPYYILPTGYGQYKKTKQGLSMFDDDLPISGSYTDKGDLRFPIEDTPKNRIQAAVFGQWASENARDYFDNERAPLKENQIQEIYGFLEKNDISFKEYMSSNEETKKAYGWAAKNPEKFTVSKAVTSDVVMYQKYTSDLNNITSDKDKYGKSISGSRKEKVIEYVNNLDIDYGAKLILFKSEYNADNTYNYDIIDYLNNRQDISYEEMETILKELGFTVLSDGTIQWD